VGDWFCITCGANVGGRDGVCPNCGPLTERQRAAEMEWLRSVSHAAADLLLRVVDEDADCLGLSENVNGPSGDHERTTRFIHAVDCDQPPGLRALMEACHHLDWQPCARDCGGVYITTELDGDVLEVVEVRLAE